MEFTITGSGDEYIDLSSPYLHMAASISVGGVTEDDKVAPVNNWVQSLFSQVDVSLNGKMTYKKSNFMWYKDTTGRMHDLGDENIGYTKRRNLTENGKKVDMIGYIQDKAFRQARLPPLGVMVKVRFVRATEQFSFMLLLLFAFQVMFISIWISHLEIAEFPDSVRRSAP